MTCLADLLTPEEYHREPQANITLVGSKALQIRPSASVENLLKLLVNMGIRIHGPRLWSLLKVDAMPSAFMKDRLFTNYKREMKYPYHYDVTYRPSTWYGDDAPAQTQCYLSVLRHKRPQTRWSVVGRGNWKQPFDTSRGVCHQIHYRSHEPLITGLLIRSNNTLKSQKTAGFPTHCGRFEYQEEVAAFPSLSDTRAAKTFVREHGL